MEALEAGLPWDALVEEAASGTVRSVHFPDPASLEAPTGSPPP
jgi:hypothetical protein